MSDEVNHNEINVSQRAPCYEERRGEERILLPISKMKKEACKS